MNKSCARSIYVGGAVDARRNRFVASERDDAMMNVYLRYELTVYDDHRARFAALTAISTDSVSVVSLGKLPRTDVDLMPMTLRHVHRKTNIRSVNIFTNQPGTDATEALAHPLCSFKLPPSRQIMKSTRILTAEVTFDYTIYSEITP